MTLSLSAYKQGLYSCCDLLKVVFSASQLSWLTSEQAWAVTDEQWQKLDYEQRQALSMALYEGDAMLGHRGQSDCIIMHYQFVSLYLKSNEIHINKKGYDVV